MEKGFDFRGDVLQRNTGQPLIAEACVAVQFVPLSMLSPKVATAKVSTPLAPILQIQYIPYNRHRR
jgi:hypothetical protein